MGWFTDWWNSEPDMEPSKKNVKEEIIMNLTFIAEKKKGIGSGTLYSGKGNFSTDDKRLLYDKAVWVSFNGVTTLCKILHIEANGISIEPNDFIRIIVR